jgi:hypothetical protein
MRRLLFALFATLVVSVLAETTNTVSLADIAVDQNDYFWNTTGREAVQPTQKQTVAAATTLPVGVFTTVYTPFGTAAQPLEARAFTWVLSDAITFDTMAPLTLLLIR